MTLQESTTPHTRSAASRATASGVALARIIMKSPDQAPESSSGR